VDQFITAARPWGEVLGFAKDIVLAVAVVYGLRQVVLTKQSLDVAQKQRLEDQQRAIEGHERASKTVTLEYARSFAQDFGDRYLNYVRAAAAAGPLPPHQGPVGDFRLTSLSPVGRNMALLRSQLPQCGAALDQLEIFAAAHTNGVADDEVGFSLNGRMFCAIVGQDFYDVLCLEREQGFYESVVALFRLWSPRLERAKLTKSKELIELQRAEVERQRAEVEKQMEELGKDQKARTIGSRS
jgi:hypothetical protein